MTSTQIVVIGTIVFFIVNQIIWHLAGKDCRKIFIWIKYVLIIVLPLNVILLLYQYKITGRFNLVPYEGYEFNGTIMLLLIFNLIMALLALLFWVSLKLYKKNDPNRLSAYLAGNAAVDNFMTVSILEFVLAFNIYCFVCFLRGHGGHGDGSFVLL